MEGKKLYKISITGRVQGVGFRYSARTRARNNGITGFVKNMSDGSVYIEAEGREDSLRQFVEWCRKGPVMGNVKDLNIEKEDPKNYEEFNIKH